MDNETFERIFTEVFIEQERRPFHDFVNFVEAASPKTIVEIGMNRGGTLNFWRNIVPNDGLVIGIDAEDKIPAVLHDDHRVDAVIGNSTFNKVYRDFIAVLDGKSADFLFIDGGHRYSEAKSDFYTYGWHVKKGGLIGFHDIDLNSQGYDIGASMHFWHEVKERAGPFWEVVYEVHQHTGFGVVQKRV